MSLPIEGFSHVRVTVGLGVAHDGVKDIGLGCQLEFRDPDNSALELWADAG
jgi:hypothetical protein